MTSENVRSSEWRQHGWILAGSACGIAIYSFHAYSLGALMTPLVRDTGWSRSLIASAILFPTIAMLLLSPVIASLLERQGTRRVVLPGILLYGCALAAIGLCPPHPAAWIVTWIIAGVLFMGANTLLWTRAVALRFDRNRGLALAIALSAAGVANALIPTTAVALEQLWGWRGAYLGLGLLAIIVAFPINFIVMRDQSAEDEATAGPVADIKDAARWTVRTALGARLFWQLAIAFSLVSAAVGTIMVHLQPMMRDAGMSAETAAGYAALYGPALIAGRLLGGYLVDRLDPRAVSFVSFLLPGLACLLLIGFDGGQWQSAAVPVFAGLGAGVEVDLIAFMVSRYFGMKAYPLVFGMIFGLFGISSSLSPVFAASVFDALGNYDMSLIALAAAAAVGALLMALLPPIARHVPFVANNPTDIRR